MNAQILIIEDENSATMSIKPKLEHLGYNILATNSNGIKSKKLKPDLILMYLTLKEEMDEIDATINILDSFDVPILYLINSSDKEIFERTGLTDEFSYIAEPFEDNKIKSAIETALYKHSPKLKEDEEKYRSIFENTGIATVILEENTTISKVNAAFEKFSGYLKEELEGKKKWNEFILPPHVQEIEEYHDLIRIDPKSTPINYNFKFIDRYNEVKDVHSTVAMITETKRTIISLLDITDNENSKKTLKESEKYSQLIENAHEGILSTDDDKITLLNPRMVELSGLSKSEILNVLLENEKYQKAILSTVQTGIVIIDAETKRIIDINESALKFIGAQRDKVIGHICHRFICPSDEGHCPIIDYNHVLDNSERILLNLNNEEIPIIKTVAPITLKGHKYLIESFIDIKKLRLTENALRKSEAVLRSFFNSNNVFMSVIELIDNDIIYILPNRHMAEFFGGTIEDITGKHLTDLDVPPNLQNFLIKKIKECLEKGTINIEFNFSNKNYERWYHGSISQINEKSSKKFSFVAIEITETKLMEDKLKASLKEKELLLHEIHHRVKNNLQIISSLLSLQSKYIQDEDTLNIFKESQNRVMSLAMIHEKLYKSSNLVKIDFAEYVKDLTDNLFYIYKISPNNIQLSIDIDSIFFNIETAIPCGLIINELVTNSLKHAFSTVSDCGPADEKVRPTLTNIYEPSDFQCSPSVMNTIKPPTNPFKDQYMEKNKINIKLNEVDENFRLSITDNGIGLSNDFDFKNTSSLGLQLVTSLVDQLDGIITLDKTRGTNFKIIFKKMKYKKRL
jgi:PAS domain S-box-containing protein